MSICNDLVVHSDNHGRPELIYAIDKRYDGNVQQLLVGDILDGPDTKAAIQAACDVGARLLMGNHEWDFLASALEVDEERRYEFAASVWPRVHDRVLESYGAAPYRPTPLSAQRLFDKMPSSHQDLLMSAPLFHETDTELIIHGGVTAESWEAQRCKLVSWGIARFCSAHYFYEDDYVPPQIREIELIGDENVLLSGLGKILINGHFHRPFNGLVDRWSNDRNRLYLATDKNDDFALVWESWTGDLVQLGANSGELSRYAAASARSAT